MLDTLLTFIAAAGSAIASLLPLSPFQQWYESGSLSSVQQGLEWLNWFVPIGDFLAIMTTWLLAIGLFYLYRAALHWIGAIS